MPITPTGRERTFAREELIVSKTDPKGRIVYANDVFLRVSGYACDEVVGQPHSMIRHPQMPRGLFKLLWDRISTGHEVFAYINNLAKDGDHYWVLAHVTPSYDAKGSIDGYHSNRRAPSAAGVRTVDALYRRMLVSEEKESNARAAAEAGYSVLSHYLAEAGMDYDEFIWTIIDQGRVAA